MRVGIIGAMDVEVTSIKERMAIDKIEQVGDNTYCLGKIGDTEVVVARCGIGKVNAAICATTMCVKYDITHILNTGIAGSLDNQNFGAKCCEMEGCAIAHVATDFAVPFVIVRAISDKADEESTVSYEDFEAQAAEHCANLVFQVLQSL